MADILIVCVREDEPQAKALADMFEAAGFTIGGAPSSDAALRASGAGVVVWSQASIRSRPFLDAAQRVINAGKAVVASLIEPPPASSIGSSPAFDLSVWDGDPNDPVLDPLFFAIDRMVNSARASVGAAAEIEPEDFEPPPRVAARAAPAPAAAPRRGSSAPAAPSSEYIGAEAEHWRSIRESREPADFMDYLARYGADGAFADVAELRLKQLTDNQTPRASQRGAAPAVRPMTPPRATQRLDPPPPRRAEPPPRRMEAPPRRPPIERGYDRMDTREPPREGGAMRTFVLIGLLGGAAVAGLYFGGGLPGMSAATDARPADEALELRPTPPPSNEAADAFDNPEPESFSLADAVPPPPQTSRRPATPRAAAPERNVPPPAPVTSWNTVAALPQGGPMSLSPSGQPTSTPGAVIPLAPPAEALPLEIASVENEITASTRAPSVGWAQRPSPARIAELYPERAARGGVGGRVQLDCTVQANLRIACGIASETPANMGFGRAALSAANSWRAQPTLSDGAPSVGTRTRLALNFRPPTE